MAGGKIPEKPSGTSENVKGEAVSGELDRRLDRLEGELARKGVLKRPASGDEGRPKTSGSVAQAMKLSSEFVAGVVVGALIGWTIDHLAGTSPWGLIVFLLLGFAACILNLLRSAGLAAKQGDFKTSAEKDERK